MKKLGIICLVFSVFAFCAQPLLAGDVKLLELTKNSASDYCVVLSADASESEKFAASEFVAFIKQISGAELAIRGDSGTPLDGAVYIGFGQSVKSLDVEIDFNSLGTDGFVIRSVGKNLIIAGGRKRGTLYGVYDFLETLGCRWWTPWESFIPSEKSIKLGPINITEMPVLEYRDMMYGEMFGDEGQLWAARNKINGMAWDDAPATLGGRYEFVGNLVHSYMGLLSLGTDGNVTDEMVALRNGRRQRTQPCLSNPDVLEAISRAVVKKYRETPSARFVVVGQNDNKNYCQCENCQEIMDRYSAPSGIVIWFANKIIAEVRKEIPDANICTAAYQWSRKPPVGISPADGVHITLCSIECDFAHPLSSGSVKENVAFRDDIIGWGRIADKVFIWDYTPNFHHFLMPHPNLDVLVDNIRFFAANSAAGVFEQGCHETRGGEMAELRMWVLAKALWEPKLDGQQLIDEFVEGYYGPAAAAASQYIELFQEMVRAEPDKKMRMIMEPSAWYLHPKTIARCLEILNSADMAVAYEPAYLRRLAKVKNAPLYVAIKAGPESNTFKLISKGNNSVSYKSLADSLAFSLADWQVSKIAEREKIGPWLAWLKDFSQMVADGNIPRPEEADAEARIIQAAQIDSKLASLEQAEGASDGWALKCNTNAWLCRKHFTTFDDITPGKSYKLFIRVKCQGGKPAEGNRGFMAGVRSSGGNKTLRVNMDEITADSWQVFEVAQWTAHAGDQMFYALEGGSRLDAVLLDVMWLEKLD